MKKIFLTLLFLQINIFAFSQVDTVLVNSYFEKALSFEKTKQADSALIFYDKTISLCQLAEALSANKKWATQKQLICLNKETQVFMDKSKFDKALTLTDSVIVIGKRNFGDSTSFAADAFNDKGLIYVNKSNFDKAIENLFISLAIRKKLYGEINIDVAQSYNNIGNVYDEKGESSKALDNFFKSLDIYKKIYGEKHKSIAKCYNNIGIVYRKKAEYDKALEYYFMSLEIYRLINGDKQVEVAMAYNNIGTVYKLKNELDKSLEYYLLSLSIYIDLLGDKHALVASSYNNLGNTYAVKQDYDLALKYYFKSLEIKKQLIGGKSLDIANTNNNIGNIYLRKTDYDNALEYYFKSLDMRKSLVGEKHISLATNYNNIGNVYAYQAKFDKALEYSFKGLEIRKRAYDRKHPAISTSYNNIGDIYFDSKKYETALKYYDLGLVSNLRYFNDTIHSLLVPEIDNYLEYGQLIKSLQSKAKCLAVLKNWEVSLMCYKACDELIGKVRKNMTKQSDKMALGELASQIYEGAIHICDVLITRSQKLSDKNRYGEMSLYFSEQNKSSVLLEALAGQEAQKYAGIPEDLLQSEHQLTTDIASYTEQLAELGSADSVKIGALQKKLFNCNRSHDSLIVVFEKKYPKYHDLKYNVNTASVKDIQNLIGKKTAMLSYFVGDSTVTVYTITKDLFNIEQKNKPEDLCETVEFFRNSLTNQNRKSDKAYRKYGTSLYEMLFPKDLDKNIGNLIIVPDGVLATIPFETLLTSKVADTTQFQNLPYLVKKYSISYCSSATLFKETFTKKKGGPSEVRPLNDWIAYAPVFDDENSQGTSLSSRALLRELHKINKDSTLTRGLMMGSGEVVPPLPGSENEVKSIFNEFDKQNLKTTVELKGNASERNIKSGELENYKYIHFATHGFVNSEKPELSGLLLAQVADSTNEQNDGILYSGEIFNLKLNADLVVLSACETGLGQIKKGEGIIGLTRALLYAGAKNLMVSLWPVSDQSTSDLMISFYKNLLDEKSAHLSNTVRFAPLLQKAKLKMISETKFARPFYWSPFILIGQ